MHIFSETEVVTVRQILKADRHASAHIHRHNIDTDSEETTILFSYDQTELQGDRVSKTWTIGPTVGDMRMSDYRSDKTPVVNAYACVRSDYMSSVFGGLRAGDKFEAVLVLDGAGVGVANTDVTVTRGDKVRYRGVTEVTCNHCVS